MGSEHRNSAPYYQQVANILRAQIISVEGDAPVQLPTERELGQVHRVSRETIRKALEVLEADGLIERAPSRGTLTVPGGIRAWRKLRQARLIAVVSSSTSASDVPGSYYGQILQGIFQRAEEVGYSISTRWMGAQFPAIRPSDNPEDPAKVLGVIIEGIQDERVIAMHAQAGYPVVVLDHWSRNPKVDAVVIDCFNEGEQAAEFLLEQGHREFFYVGNVHSPRSGREHEADADQMLTGFARGLRRAGVVLPAERVFFCRQSPDEVAGVVEQVSQLRPRPTAGLVFSSAAFQDFVAELPKRGLSCPEDLSLICKATLGDPLEAATLRCNAGLLGRMGVDLLLERVLGKRQETACVAIRSVLQRGPTVRYIKPTE